MSREIGSAEAMGGEVLTLFDDDSIVVTGNLGNKSTLVFTAPQMLNLLNSFHTLGLVKQSKMKRAREYWASKLYGKILEDLNEFEKLAIEKVLEVTKGELGE